MLNENFADKLKLLDYDNHFCKGRRMKPVHRHYFACVVPPTRPTDLYRHPIKKFEAAVYSLIDSMWREHWLEHCAPNPIVDRGTIIRRSAWTKALIGSEHLAKNKALPESLLTALCVVSRSIPGSANEQLYMFANLMSWLLDITGVDFPAPDQYDDPNTTVQDIMATLQTL